MDRWKSPLWLILALFLGLHALYNWAIPLGEGPDEPGHLAYVLFLAFEQRLPVQRQAPEPSDVAGEGHQPPLAYALTLPAVAWLPPEDRSILLTANPDFIWAGGDQPGAFMRSSREQWPWQGLPLAWHLARAVVGLCGAATVALTYLAAQRLAPGERGLAVLAATLIACNPQFIFSSALVTNDPLLAAFGALLLWHGLANPPATWRWAVQAGLLFGLALLTKQSALLLGPLLLWGSWRVAAGNWRQTITMSLIWAVTTLLIAGWWFVRNLLLYGDLFGLAIFQYTFAGQAFAWGDRSAWEGAIRQLFTSYWARFGWMSVHPPDEVFWIYTPLSLLAAVGWARHLWRRGRQKHGGDQGWLSALLVVVMAILWILAFVSTAGLVAWQGRMLFPASAAIALLMAGGLRAWWQGRVWWAKQLPRLLGAGLFALALWMPWGVIRPAYQWVVLDPRSAQASLGSTVFARYAGNWEQGVTLRGWRTEGAAHRGSRLPITLTWQASLEPIPLPWTVFVHLVDGEGNIVAKSNSQPRGGTLPFPLWTPGDWVADTHYMELPADLPAGSYQLRVGLYLPEAGSRRQQVWDALGQGIGDLALVGELEVRP